MQRAERQNKPWQPSRLAITICENNPQLSFLVNTTQKEENALGGGGEQKIKTTKRWGSTHAFQGARMDLGLSDLPGKISYQQFSNTS